MPQPQPQRKFDTRNVDALTAEVEAMAVDAARARKDVDNGRSPIDGLTRDDVEANWSSKDGMLDAIKTQASTIVTTSQQTPGQILYYSTPVGYSAITVGPGGQGVLKILTPVEELHERNSQASPRSTRPSLPASPLSPGAPATASLSRVALTPVDPTDPGRGQYVYVVDSHAPLASHPTARPRRDASADRLPRARAASQGPTSRRRLSAARPPPSTSNCNDNSRDSRLPIGYIYNDPNNTGRIRHQTVAYVNPRSRSLEPVPSPRHFLTPSPVDSLTSSSTTDVEPDAGALADTEDSNSTTDEDPLFSPRDPDKYFEARQMWNGAAGEGRRGFYGNVRDDYRLIGKDVSTITAGGAGKNVAAAAPNVPVTGSVGVKLGDAGEKRKGLVMLDNVKIAGVDGVGDQALVPSAEELWG
jgi:hypothetical protein